MAPKKAFNICLAQKKNQNNTTDLLLLLKKKKPVACIGFSDTLHRICFREDLFSKLLVGLPCCQPLQGAVWLKMDTYPHPTPPRVTCFGDSLGGLSRQIRPQSSIAQWELRVNLPKILVQSAVQAAALTYPQFFNHHHHSL